MERYSQQYYGGVGSRRRKRRRWNPRFFIAIGVLLLSIAGILFAVSRCSRPTGQDPGTDPTDPSNPQQQVEPGPDPVVEPEDKFTVCIDPGHGYDDGGCVSTNLGKLCEKDITLAVSLKLRTELEALGLQVVMTRDSDTPPEDMEPNSNGRYIFSATKRPPIINAYEPDMSISLHCDSFDDSRVTGMSIYHYESNNPELTPYLAQHLQDGIVQVFPEQKVTIRTQGADTAFALVKGVQAPAVLVEMGFVTNPEEAKNMLDEQWQSNLAKAMAQGILAYAQWQEE